MHKGAAMKIARDLHRMGFTLYATAGTAVALERERDLLPSAGILPGEQDRRAKFAERPRRRLVASEVRHGRGGPHSRRIDRVQVRRSPCDCRPRAARAHGPIAGMASALD